MLVKISEHVALSLQAEDREAPPGERSRDIQDLFKYKRSLLRSLYSSLEKARPEGPDARLKALYDEVVDGGSRGADEEVFLARPLESNRSDEHAALDRKRALMRRMNEVSLVPETEISLIQQVQRLLMRLRSWFTGRR